MPYNSLNRRQKYQREYYRHVTKRHRGGESGHLGRVKQQSRDEPKILIQIRLPFQLVGRVSQLLEESVALHRYPWRTKTAIYTYLLVQGFKSMKQDPFIAEMIPYLEAIEGVEAWKFNRIEAQRAFSRITQEIGELLGIRAIDHAAQLYHHSVDSFANLAPNIWRDWLLEKLKKQYPHLAKLRVKPISYATRAPQTERRRRPRR